MGNLIEDAMKGRVRVDFNGLFGGLLCLSHEDGVVDDSGVVISLREGLVVTAYDEDADETGARDDLLATGVVERSPEWLKCSGSRWVLRIDSRGVRHQSESDAMTQ